MTIAALAPFRKPAPGPTDDDDFAVLYRTYQPQLVRYVTHHFGPRDAEEITQEALTRALRSLERERSGAETWAWLIRVARNVAHDIARSRRICDATDDDAVLADEFADDAELPEPAALLDERRRLVRHALKSLPATQRRILVLYEVDELPCPAIARLVGSNEYAVRKALQRARARFAAEFRALGGGAFGSFAFWFRGLGRRAWKAAPATSASGALCVVAGTLAITSGIYGAPRVDVSPNMAPPAAVSSLDSGEAVARSAAAMRKADRATRSTRPTVARIAVAPRGERPGGGSGPNIPGPNTPLTPGQHTRIRVAVETPIGPVEYDEEVIAEEAPGPVCQLDSVVCWYEDDDD